MAISRQPRHIRRGLKPSTSFPSPGWFGKARASRHIPYCDAAIDTAEAGARGVDRVIAKPYRISDLRQVADHVAGALAKR
jgi:hypothetical protein